MSDASHAVAEQIIEAARSCFLRLGYSRVSTEEIARSIGRSKKTLYKFFASKEVLLQAVLARIDIETQGIVAGIAAERGIDRPSRLRRILGAVAGHLTGSYRVLLDDLRANAPELGLRTWQERRQALGRLLIPVLNDGVAAGAVRGDMAIDEMLTIFFDCIEGCSGPVEKSPDARRSSAVVNLLVDGLRRR